MLENNSAILVLNGGSSSIKLSLFKYPPPAESGDSSALLWSKNISINIREAGDDTLQSILLENISDNSAGDIFCIGHRVVHGGADLRKSCLIDESVEAQIAALSELAPVHNPIAARIIKQAKVLFPDAKHIAVFDTAFHSSIEKNRYLYAVPYNWYRDLGIRRYGFHGINHQYCWQAAKKMLAADSGNSGSCAKLVSCHLGNGCSLAAVRNGKSIDTTMGFTPLEGLIMGARSGTIDPGIIFYLMREKNFNIEELDRTLNNHSGMLAVSGISKDMREIEAAAASGNERAKLAFELFVLSVQKHIASMAASLSGLDSLIFTAGIGEHSAAVRSAVCDGLAFLGIKLDPEKNRSCKQDAIISSHDSQVKVLRIEAREDLQIYRECQSCVSVSPSK